MSAKREVKIFLFLLAGFLIAYFMPLDASRFTNAISEALWLMQDYAREHVVLCLLPAFFIAGAIAVFISQGAVIKYLGAKAKKIVSYSVAAVSGTILAVCSCTVLPLFAGIYTRGAGIGPATAFLYSGPAINILAIILTARVLGAELGIARAVGAISFSVVIGLLMHFFFRKDEKEKAKEDFQMPVGEVSRPIFQTIIFFAMMILILVFANWSSRVDTGIWYQIFSIKWFVVSVIAALFAVVLVLWFKVKIWKIAALTGFVAALAIVLVNIDDGTLDVPLISFGAGALGLGIITLTSKDENKEWFNQSWFFTKQMLPLLLAGVFVAGFLLGRPGGEGIIPSEWVKSLLGGNSIFTNFFASIAGAFMYFATLTEVPIIQGLLGSGMGKGPALALLLAGPALSLPNMLIIRSIMGTKKTLVFICLVVVMATFSGWFYGAAFN